MGLVKMNNRDIPWGKGGRCVRLTTSPPSCAECHEIWETKTPGTLWATPDLLRGFFYLFICFVSVKDSTEEYVRNSGVRNEGILYKNGS